MRKAENKVRIVAQLIDVKSDTHVWTETYDREITEIFDIQSQIAKSVADGIKVIITPMEKQQIENEISTLVNL